MPRRTRPWCNSGALVFLMSAGTSTAFFQVKHGGSGAAVGAGAWSVTSAACTADSRDWNDRGTRAVDSRRRRRFLADRMLRMVAQQQQETQLPENAAKLAAGAAAGTAAAKPFVSRQLGSFEKMLTQTRDGVGPAEEGVRTLLTPHVWVSAWSWSPNSLKLWVRIEKESARHVFPACLRAASEKLVVGTCMSEHGYSSSRIWVTSRTAEAFTSSPLPRM